MKLLTVALPVHNAGRFLPDAVNSLLRQTYEDFELLLVDDGSTDGSLEYLKSIKDRRVRLISQQHSGLTATLNRMLAEAATPWLVRHDADDVAFPERLALTAESIRRFPDAGMFYSYARYYQNDRIFGNFRTTSGTPEQLRELTKAGYLLAICHPAVTLNVRKAVEAGGYRFDLHVEDADLWWRMALAYRKLAGPGAESLLVSALIPWLIKVEIMNPHPHIMLCKIFRNVRSPNCFKRDSLCIFLFPRNSGHHSAHKPRARRMAGQSL